jgi:hypothetical protein
VGEYLLKSEKTKQHEETVYETSLRGHGCRCRYRRQGGSTIAKEGYHAALCRRSDDGAVDATDTLGKMLGPDRFQPIDAAIGWEQPDGSRAHRLAGETKDDNMAHPDRIAEVYLQLHRQHRSTWTFEVVLRPWTEKW